MKNESIDLSADSVLPQLITHGWEWYRKTIGDVPYLSFVSKHIEKGYNGGTKQMPLINIFSHMQKLYTKKKLEARIMKLEEEIKKIDEDIVFDFNPNLKLHVMKMPSSTMKAKVSKILRFYLPIPMNKSSRFFSQLVLEAARMKLFPYISIAYNLPVLYENNGNFAVNTIILYVNAHREDMINMLLRILFILKTETVSKTWKLSSVQKNDIRVQMLKNFMIPIDELIYFVEMDSLESYHLGVYKEICKTITGSYSVDTLTLSDFCNKIKAFNQKRFRYFPFDKKRDIKNPALLCS